LQLCEGWDGIIVEHIHVHSLYLVSGIVIATVIVLPP
jgi:hypothetical protein